MGEAYRGLTIRFAADGTKVLSTLKAMRRAGADVESELRLVNRALKFDGANQTAAARQLKLMAERAGAAGGEANRLRKELRLLGNQDIGGKKMRELSKETKDASTQASLMRERYNAATKSLAELQNEAEQLWYTSKNLGVLPNPFTGWSEMPTEQIQEFMKMLFRTGDISTATWKRMSSSVKELRAEFNLAEGELKKLNNIAEYQSAEDKLLQLEAAAKRYRNALRDAALQERATGHEFNLDRARASITKTEAAVRKLGEAMKLDPKSFEAAIGHARMLEAEMQSVEAESDALRAEIRQLGSAEGVMELANDARRLQEEFIASGRRVDTLAEKLGKAVAAADRLEEEAGQLNVKLAKAGETAGEELRSKVKSTEEAAKAARVEANNLQKEFDQAAEAAEKVNAALKVTENRTQIAANNARQQAAAANKANKSLISNSAMTSLGMSMYATVYPAAMMGGSYAIQAAEEVDSAYRDMRKTVQGTESDFERLKQAALEFGDTHVTSADMVLEFEAMGGQLGIAVQDLEAFSTTVANLDIATNIDAEDVAIELGKMASILQISSDEYDNFADALVRLGNSEPALESDIMNITARFGAMAHIVGMTPDQILAVATAATATGQKAEAAGGALQRILGGIETKVSGVSEAMKELDWEGDDLEEFQAASENLEGLASVAGMTADEFARAWEHDAAGAFQSFIEGLKKHAEEGGSVQALLYDKLGYHNIRDLQLLQGLTNTTQVMTESLSMASNAYAGISDQWGTAGDAANEAAKKSEGFSGQLQILKNNGQHMADMLGESLLPLMKDLTGAASDGTKFFENMGDGAKQLTMGLVGLAVAAGPALTFIAASKNAAASLKTSLAEYASVKATMSRVDSSYIMTQAGLGNIYRKNGEAIAANKARSRELAATQATLNKNTQAGVVTSRALGKEQLKIAQQNQKMQRQNKLIAAGGTAVNALKSVGTMAGFAVGAAVIEQVIAKLIEAKDKADQFEAATKGVESVADVLNSMDTDIADGVKKAGGEFDSSAVQVQNLHEKTEALTAANADFAKSTLASMDEMRGSAIMAEYWGQKVIDLSTNFDGSAGQLAQLKTAIQQYNETTGSNIRLVDEQTGRLNANSEAINLNTDAYKKSMEARAYTSVAEDAAKQLAETSVQYELNKQKIAELIQEQKQYNSASKEYSDITQQIRTLEQDNSSLLEQEAAMQQTADAALELAESRRADADAASEELKKNLETTQSAKAYSKVLKELGGKKAFTEMAENAGYTKETLDDFAKALANSGIQAETLADLGTEAFNRLVADCGGDLDTLNGLLNTFNSMGLDPKTVTIKDDGVLDVEGHILDLQNLTIDGKSFTVTAEGVQGADEETNQLLKDVGILGKQVAKPDANLQDNASGKIADIASALSRLDGKSATVDVYENTHKVTYNKTVNQGTTNEGGSATGGISRSILRQIPRHADGGLSGIVTRATLTNQGWVGEDGDEALIRQGRSTAIVPLSNRRYVRPFARAVASEIPGRSGNPVNVTVNLGYHAGEDASRLAVDVTNHIRDIMNLEA